MKLSLVLVAYRSAEWLPVAIDSFRREAATSGYSAEVIVVDHSEDEAERERIASCCPDRLLSQPNRGFAAGVNVGTAEANGELLLVGNPDIELHPGALAPLVAALESGWDVVGPQFVLGEFMLPPSDVQTPRAELARRLATRWPLLGRRVLASEARRWCGSWEARQPVSTPALSGALMAFSSETLRTVGPWDEEYFLYFEETDWLRRAAGAGLRVALVPEARVTHGWGHAAEPAAFQEVFQRSRRRFYRSHFGWLGRWICAWNGQRTPERVEALNATAVSSAPEDCWWLLAFSPEGLPAAGTRVENSSLPAAVRRFLALQPACPDPFLIAFDARRGSSLGLWRWAGGRSVE